MIAGPDRRRWRPGRAYDGRAWSRGTGRKVVVLERCRPSRAAGRSPRSSEGSTSTSGRTPCTAAGHAFRLLQELGVPFTGASPTRGAASCSPASRSYAHPAGHRLAARVAAAHAAREVGVSCASSRPSRGSMPARFDRVPLGDWIGTTAGTGNLAGLLADAVPGQHLRRRSRAAVRRGGDRPVEARPRRQRLVSRRRLADARRRPARPGRRARGGAPDRARVESVRGDGGGVTVRAGPARSLRGRAAVLAVDPEAACDLLDLPDGRAARPAGRGLHPGPGGLPRRGPGPPAAARTPRGLRPRPAAVLLGAFGLGPARAGGDGGTPRR